MFSPVDVFQNDLPQLYTKPGYEKLLELLKSLKRVPRSWYTTESEVIRDPGSINNVPKYLTSVIKSPLSWIEDEEEREKIWEEASKRLSERTGRSGMPAVDREFVIPGTEYCLEFSISLHEPTLTGDELGLKTWGTSFALAKCLSRIGEKYIPHVRSGIEVLELGSGTGLVGMAAAVLWKAKVILSDMETIMNNLKLNVGRNEEMIVSRGGLVETITLDWNKVPVQQDRAKVLLASDPLYSPEHPRLIAAIIDQMALMDDGTRVIIGVPMRDEATRKMKDELDGYLSGYRFRLLHEESLQALDDWEDANGETASVECLCTVWYRESAVEGLRS